MTWIKLDDTLPNNPKILPLSNAGFRLYIEGLCYANQYLTDGFIPKEIAKHYGNPLELIEMKLWRETQGGYLTENEGLFKIDRPPAHLWSAIRAKIFERDDYTCQYCGNRGGKLECDHVYPVAKGGSHDENNLVTACFKCNRSKKDKTLEEWRASK